jgi:hypothetical protein
LPVVQRLDNETDEEMADRIAQTIASDLGILSSKFTAKDKVNKWGILKLKALG